jgi:two-component system, LytTR family, sensor histidine kinase AgrC
MEKHVSSDASMHLARRQRHSFLNHLQVISGWLQLGRQDRARQYLETVAERMTAESQALKQVPSPLGLVMLELGLDSETHGVDLQWLTGNTVEGWPEAVLEDLRKAVLDAVRTGSLEQRDGRRLVVSLTPGGFSVHTPSEATEG